MSINLEQKIQLIEQMGLTGCYAGVRSGMVEEQYVLSQEWISEGRDTLLVVMYNESNEPIQLFAKRFGRGINYELRLDVKNPSQHDCALAIIAEVDRASAPCEKMETIE